MGRLVWIAGVLVLLALAGCGHTSAGGDRARRLAFPHRELKDPASGPTAEPGFDADASANFVGGESEAEDERILELAGHRADFRIPRSLLAGLQPGPMAHAAVIRIEHELFDFTGPRYRRLNAGQRAVFAMILADDEILNGGFDQFWFNSSGAVAPDLVEAARRVGAPEYAEVFSDANALFPGGRVPRKRGERQRVLHGLDDRAVARLDERYATFQYHRATAIGLILGRYVRAHLDEFTV